VSNCIIYIFIYYILVDIQHNVDVSLEEKKIIEVTARPLYPQEGTPVPSE
jgi:hypothetical protein